jgi:threonine/homoserine/homoserine lactone efflux protein
MEFYTWIYFLLTVMLLAATPGPNVFLCISTSIQDGFKLSIYSAIGGFTATSIIFTLSFVGLGAIILNSEFYFNLIKYTGAIYLIYLGYKALSSKQKNFDFKSNTIQGNSIKKSFITGFIVGISNPKAIVFFAALFPQFINTKEPLLLQFIILYSTFLVFELFWLILYAYFASKSSKWFKEEGRANVFNKTIGSIFVLMGSIIAFSK